MAETPRFELSTYEKAQAQLKKSGIQNSSALDQQIAEAKNQKPEQRISRNQQIVEKSWADTKVKESNTVKDDKNAAADLLKNYPYSAAQDSQKANVAMIPPAAPIVATAVPAAEARVAVGNMNGLAAPVAAPVISNETSKPLDLSSDFFKKISEKGVNGEYIITDVELTKYKDSLKSLLKLPNEPIKLDAAQDGKSLSIVNDITGFTVKIDNKGDILAFGTPNKGTPNDMQNFVDTLAQGIQSPLAVPVNAKPTQKKRNSNK